MKCKECNFDMVNKDKRAKFCSSSCSAKYNNKLRGRNKTTCKCGGKKGYPAKVCKDCRLKEISEKPKVSCKNSCRCGKQKRRISKVCINCYKKERRTGKTLKREAMLKCEKHGLTIHKAYGRSARLYCLKCSHDRITEQRRKNKIKLSLYFGGKCIKCGYDKCINGLTFHHRDESTKKFGIGSGHTKSYDKLLEEAEKCDLLCHNCHSEVHARPEDFNWKEQMREWLFFKLLKWFCSKRLDQWERWKIETKYGSVFVEISREDDGYNWTELK